MTQSGFCPGECGAACPQCIAAATALLFADAALADAPAETQPPQPKAQAQPKAPAQRWGPPSLRQPPQQSLSEAEAEAHRLYLQTRRERYAARKDRSRQDVEAETLDHTTGPSASHAEPPLFD